jgi:hypothetical protein
VQHLEFDSLRANHLSNNVLSFTVVPGTGANGLQVMLPVDTGSLHLDALTLDGNPVASEVRTIKGFACYPVPFSPCALFVHGSLRYSVMATLTLSSSAARMDGQSLRLFTSVFHEYRCLGL